MLGAMDLLFALGRDDLRVVRYCSGEGRPPCRPLPMRERLTELSALRDSWIFMWFQVPVVDTEVDPLQQNSRPIRLRIVSPR